ncbi:cysteine peptidase family C39 domain-containing protein [Sorangium sp. So ce291]|uniref:cysteine peptidase family C39 domain-containing protein n=1 Tax=Sorangium sp. So ce291 TaxID=3133294 RepID=UPI003F63A698
MGLDRSWSAEFYEGGKLAHVVVVDGRQGNNPLIRDPWRGGNLYQMSLDEFRRVWTGNAAFI